MAPTIPASEAPVATAPAPKARVTPYAMKRNTATAPFPPSPTDVVDGNQSSSDGSTPSGGAHEALPRAAYIAPKTKGKSLRGSIVIKADTIKKAEGDRNTPSDVDKQSFPSFFMSSLLAKKGSTESTGRGANGTASADTDGDTDGSDDAPSEQAYDEAKSKNEWGLSSNNTQVRASVHEAVQRVRQGGHGADYVVVEWRKRGDGDDAQEQLEVKEVRRCFLSVCGSCRRWLRTTWARRPHGITNTMCFFSLSQPEVEAAMMMRMVREVPMS